MTYPVRSDQSSEGTFIPFHGCSARRHLFSWTGVDAAPVPPEGSQCHCGDVWVEDGRVVEAQRVPWR